MKKSFKKYIKKSLLRLNESDIPHLHMSILAAGKWLTSEKKKAIFLSSPAIVEMKSDGVHLTALKIGSTGNFEKDWIIAYKGNILYSEEFDFAANSTIKQKSVGASQFKIALEQFKEYAPKVAKKIPVGTELFIEYLIKKPTLMSEYKRNHRMILIGYAKSTYDKRKAKVGKLITKAGPMENAKRSGYAELLGIDEPLVIFEGILGSKIGFERGIKNKQLKQLYQEVAVGMHWDNPDLLIDDLRELFLKVESKYGGKEEGVVIFLEGPGSYKYKGKSIQAILKFQQEYQLSKEDRLAKKLKFKADPETENQYWANVKLAALEIVNKINDFDKPLKDLLEIVAKELKNYRPNFEHPKKDTLNIKDDIQLTAKQLIIKKLPGNHNGLIVGRFQPLTLGHKKMIDEALSQCDNVYICIIKAKKSDIEKNPIPLEIQEEMLESTYKSIIGKKLHIITAQTGNLITIINKTKDNINCVFAGTDRVKDYEKQLERSLDVKVVEIKRTDEDISATKVRNAIKADDFETFKKLVPKQVQNYWTVLKKYVK